MILEMRHGIITFAKAVPSVIPEEDLSSLQVEIRMLQLQRIDGEQQSVGSYWAAILCEDKYPLLVRVTNTGRTLSLRCWAEAVH